MDQCSNAASQPETLTQYRVIIETKEPAERHQGVVSISGGDVEGMESALMSWASKFADDLSEENIIDASIYELCDEMDSEGDCSLGDAAGMDAAMEAEIVQKGLTAPRVTKESIDAIMAAVDYHTYVVPGTTTTVAVAMIHGFTLCQEITACVDAKNFDEELGRKYAIEKAAAVARDKLWELEGYTLKFGCVSLPDIARVAHEINRAYCEAVGDTSQEEWSRAPAWQRDSAINGVNFHLMNPDADAGLSHINWMAEKKADGWVYGETKNPEAKTHPCMVPFNQLPIEQQAKDFLFRAVVHALK